MREFMIELLALSLLMSAVIGALLLLTGKMSKRFRASCRFALWLAVIFRLAIPFGSGLLPAVISIPSESATVYETQTNENENVKENVKFQYSEGSGSISSPAAPVAPGVTDPGEPSGTNTSQSLEEGTVINENTAQIIQSGADKEAVGAKGIDKALIAPVLFFIWAAGAVCFFSVNIIRYNVLMAKMKKEIYPAEGQLLLEYNAILDELGIERAPELYISTAVQSPMLCGYLQKRIIVPPIEMDISAFRAVIAHELCHYRRGDILTKLCALLANSIHWFNPFVYAAVKRMNTEMELSCDERVIRDLCEWERVKYGKVMLDIVARSRGGAGALTTKFNPEKGAARERINNILDMTKKKKGMVIIALTVIACLITGAIIGCEAAKVNGAEKKEENEKKTEYNNLIVSNEKYELYSSSEEGSGSINEAVPLMLKVKGEKMYFEGRYGKNLHVGDLSEYHYQDITGDGILDHILFLYVSHGTGAYIEDLYVFDGESLKRIDGERFYEASEDRLEFSSDESYYYVKIDKDKHYVEKPETGEGMTETSGDLSVGNGLYEYYTIDENGLRCNYMCYAPGFAGYCVGELNISIEFDGEKLIPGSITFTKLSSASSENFGSEGWTMKVLNGEIVISKGDKTFTYGDYRGMPDKRDYAIVFSEYYYSPDLVVDEDEEYGALVYTLPRYSVDAPLTQAICIISMSDGRIIASPSITDSQLSVSGRLSAHKLPADALGAYEYNFEDPSMTEYCAYKITANASPLESGVFRIDTELSSDDNRVQLRGYFIYNVNEDACGDYIAEDTVFGEPLVKVDDIQNIEMIDGFSENVMAAARAFIGKDTKKLEELTGCESGVLSEYKNFVFGDYTIEKDKYGSLILSVEIVESSLGTVPSGRYDISINEGMYGIDLGGLNPDEKSFIGDGAMFMHTWITMMKSAYIPDEGEVSDIEEYHASVVDFMFQLIGEKSVAEYKASAEKMLGISDLRIPENFIGEDGNVYVGGHGGYVLSYEILSEEISGDTVVVTVQTYADHMQTIKSRLIKNTFKKDKNVLCVVSSEIIEDRGFDDDGFQV